MTKYLWLIGLIILAITIRILYYFHSPTYETAGDTVSYYLAGKAMVEEKRFIDPWRTPLYPVILAVPFLLGARPMPTDVVGVYIPEFWTVRIVQSIGGVLMIALLYVLLLLVGFSRRTSALYGIFIACNYLILMFEHTILTESFAVLWLVGTMYLTVSVIRRFSIRIFSLTVILWIVGTLLRPNFIALPIILSGIILLAHRTRIVIFACLAGLLVYGTVLYAYAGMNGNIYKYQGITRISDVNLLGKMLAYRLPMDSGEEKSDVELWLQSSQAAADTDPWQVFRNHPELFTNSYAMPLHTIVTKSVFRSIIPFVIDSTMELPGSLVSPSIVTDVTAKVNRFDNFFATLERIYYFGMYVNFAVFIAVPVFLWEALMNRTLKAYSLLLFSLVGLYQVCAGVYLGYDDFGRHILIAQPLLYVPSFVIWYRLIKWTPSVFRRSV